MTPTVDLVIVGMTASAADAAVDAASRGQRVLVIGESKNARYCRRLRRALDAAGDGCRERVTMLAGFEVISIDGIGAVEVVLVRNIRTGGLIGVNTGAMLAATALAPGIVAAALQNRSEQTSAGNATSRTPITTGGGSQPRSAT
jgi:hypothetical protein